MQIEKNLIENTIMAILFLTTNAWDLPTLKSVNCVNFLTELKGILTSFTARNMTKQLV